MGREGVPVLGDNVYVGIGAALVGHIKIGSGAKIAANTLVIDDVPQGATMMGVPGRVLLVPPRSIQSPSPAANAQTVSPAGTERATGKSLAP